MRPVTCLDIDIRPPMRVFYSSLPRVSNGKRWLAHDSRRRWCETVPPCGEAIDAKLPTWLYS